MHYCSTLCCCRIEGLRIQRKEEATRKRRLETIHQLVVDEIEAERLIRRDADGQEVFDDGIRRQPQTGAALADGDAGVKGCQAFDMCLVDQGFVRTMARRGVIVPAEAGVDNHGFRDGKGRIAGIE